MDLCVWGFLQSPLSKTYLLREISLNIGPLVENVETVNEVQIYLTMGVYGKKRLDPALLFPHFCLSDLDFKIKLIREREGE